MMIYMRDNRHRFKWVLGFVIFVLVLSVTFSDVYGVDTYQRTTDQAIKDSPDTSPPSAVPEPTTLILLASGLVALRLLYRKKR